MILAGDIGGTKTNLAWFEWREGQLERLEMRTFVSRDFAGLEPVLDAFLSATSGMRSEASGGAAAQGLTAACFGIAGPVVNCRCETTNLPWVVDAAALGRHLDLKGVWLLNDLEANGYGIPALRPEELLTLQEGEPQTGNAALIAAGTGLGESFLFWNGREHIPSASEGGHADFAPRNDLEIALLRFLGGRYGHVSYERILSGRGFVDLFEFLLAEGAEAGEAVKEAIAGGADPTAVISKAGMNRSDPVCVEVLELFAEIYGAEAGNIALKGLAVNGVYVGGGIAPRILNRLREGGFLRGFLDKGRFRGLLERVPVRVILNPETALLGAARYAGLASERAR